MILATTFQHLADLLFSKRQKALQANIKKNDFFYYLFLIKVKKVYLNSVFYIVFYIFNVHYLHLRTQLHILFGCI